jgi:hypothetical protein
MGQQVRGWLESDWLREGPTVCILEGFSGVGKTRLAQDLVSSAHIPAFGVWAAEGGLAADDVILEIALCLEDLDDTTMSGRLDGDLYAGLELIMDKDVLIVIDNFQDLLDKDLSMPERRLWKSITRLSARPVRGGRFLLVTNRSLPEGSWQERIAIKTLRPPDEDGAARLLARLLTDRGRENELPLARRGEVAKWLGYNPRAFQALVACLSEYSLDELIQLEVDSWSVKDEVVSPQLVTQLEHRFLNRILTKLDDTSLILLQLLSVYRRPFNRDAIERLGFEPQVQGDLFRRFLLGHDRGWFSLNRVARELARSQLVTHAQRLQWAHDSAADHFARHFRAKRQTGKIDHAGAFIEARYHLFQAGRVDEFEEIARSFRRQLVIHYGAANQLPDDRGKVLQLIATLAAALDNEDGGYARLRYFLARLLLKRGGADDELRALHQLRVAIRESLDPALWLLCLRLAHGVDGMLGLKAIASQAMKRLPLRSLPAIYHRTATLYAVSGQLEEALRTLDEGMRRCDDNSEVYQLYQATSALLTRDNRYEDAFAILLSYMESQDLTKVDDVSKRQDLKRIAEQALFVALAVRDVRAINSVRGILSVSAAFDPLLALSDVLLLECMDRFDEAAEIRRPGPTYLALSMQIAFSLICCGRLNDALRTVTSAGLQPIAPHSNWMWALVNYCNNRLEIATAVVERMVGRPVEPEEVDAVLLLQLWDDIGDVYEPSPSFYFPRLPRSVTNLDRDLVRLQWQASALDDDVIRRISFPQLLPTETPVAVMETEERDERGEQPGITVNISPSISATLEDRRGSTVSDTYNVGQAGAVGRGASAENIRFEQLWTQTEGGAEELLAQLRRLREAMRNGATEPEHDLAVAEVAQAEVSVAKGDPDAARSHLAKAGRWALTTANAIGTALAAATIKSALGL